jgi:hypothetical protein
MSIVLMGSTSGSCTLQEQAVAGTTTLTLPTTSGTVALTADIVAPTTAQVLTATAGATAGAVGSYGFFRRTTASNTVLSPNDTIAGSSLRYSSAIGTADSYSADGAAPSGTWRVLGFVDDANGVNLNYLMVCLYLRIS